MLEPLHLTPAPGAPTGRLSPLSSVFLFIFYNSISLSCLCSIAVTVTALPPTRLCRLAVVLVKPTFSHEADAAGVRRDRDFLIQRSRFLAALKTRLGLILAKAVAMRVMIRWSPSCCYQSAHVGA